MAEASLPALRTRINSIDILRGIVMVVMALDHVRDYFHKIVVEAGSDLATGPTDLNTTTPILFFTRWITHFCAPLFLFLAGTSSYLMGLKKSRKELSGFLIKRGLWLVVVEIVVINLAWTFNPFYNFFILQVIWAIGISMIILGLLIFLPFNVILFTGLVIVFGHNMLDYESINSGLKGKLIPDFLFFSGFSVYSLDQSHFFMIVYSIVPWLGVMLLGYCFGKLYSPDFDPARRKKITWLLGAALILVFVILRFINKYGDPVPWSLQPRGDVYTFLSFINVNKYPPSLDFICITIGAGLLILPRLESVQNKAADFFRIYGRVPMFYYILHLYLVHLLVVVFFYLQGFPNSLIVTPNNPFLFRPAAFGFNVWGVYAVWLFVVFALYPLCKKYDRYKTLNSRRKRWLSYL